jgi:hypothetical protein
MQEIQIMHLKLRSPGSALNSCYLLPIPTGELAHSLLLDVDDEAIDRQLSVYEKEGHDRRRFMYWEHGDLRIPQRTLEVIIPGETPVALITNYDVFLIGDAGQMLDRLFRYSPPTFETVSSLGSGKLHNAIYEKGVPGRRRKLDTKPAKKRATR